MENIVFYSCFAGTVISILSLSHLAYKEHDREQPRTLSMLAAAQDHLLVRFHKILWLCGTLFAISLYGFIIPRSPYAGWLFGAWTITYIGELLLAVIPARGQTIKLHTLIAQVMALGMIIVTFLFWFGLNGVYATIELWLTIAMTVMALLTFLDKVRFIFYELAFLYLSHMSIVIAAIALR